MAILDADRASIIRSEDVDLIIMMMLGGLLFRANGTMILDRLIESTSGNVDAWSIGAYMKCTFLHNETNYYNNY